MGVLAGSAVFVQLVGFVALAVGLLGFQANKRGNMLKFQVAASVLYAVHFYLLGAFTGAVMNGVNAGRNYAFFKIAKRTWLLPAGFMIIFALAGIITWQGPLSVLPTLAMLTGTLAFWQKNPTTIRLLELISPPLWFAYNAVAGSYPGMLAEIILFCSIILGIYRFDIKKQHPAPELSASFPNRTP